MNTVQSARPLNVQWRTAFARIDRRAHLRQRINDPAHRAAQQ